MLLIWLTRSHPESMSFTRETILRLVSESKKHEQSAAQITELHQVNIYTTGVEVVCTR